MNTKKLFKLLEMRRENEVFKYARTELKADYYLNQDGFNNFLFCTPKEGEALPILLVAHVDTVRTDTKPVKLVEDHGTVFNANGILGGDDRAGVFIILELAKKLNKKPYILFTNWEESGGVGVSEFCRGGWLKPYLDKINLFVEFDRRGINQFVYYCDISDDLRDLFSGYGYSEEYGSYSDVQTLSMNYKTAHVNLSAGYFNEHTEMEYVSLAGVEFAINNACAVLPAITKQYKVIAKTKKAKSWGNYSYDSWSNYPTHKTPKKVSAKKTKKIGEDTQKSIEPVLSCGYCGSMNLQAIDHDYYWCNGCKDYITKKEATSDSDTLLDSDERDFLFDAENDLTYI